MNSDSARFFAFWSTWKGVTTAAFSFISVVVVVALFVTAKFARLETIDEKLSSNNSRLSTIAEDLGQIKEKLTTLEVRSSEASSRGQADDRLHEHQQEAIQKVSDDLGSVQEKVARIDAIVEIIKPLVTEGLAFGRISLGEVRKIYTSDEIGDMLKDAEELFGPDGSGGGGGGGDFRVARGTYSPSGSCTGPPSNCVFMSFKTGQGAFEEQLAQIELLYNLDESDLSALLPEDSIDKNGKLGEGLQSAQDYQGRLCEWLGELAQAAMASNDSLHRTSPGSALALARTYGRAMAPQSPREIG